jgi:hypothetical protein
MHVMFVAVRVLCCLLAVTALAPAQQFQDKDIDRDALPSVPDRFTVTLFARGPSVYQPCSMAFDARGRLFSVEERPDRLMIALRGMPVAEYVFADPRVLRPYFAELRTPGGVPVTRPHPPVPGVDATDHDTMHPGLWLGFGDISGHDFWRNRGRIEHVRFVERPAAQADWLAFATESRLLTADGTDLCRMVNRFRLGTRPAGWLLDWQASFRAETGELSFGDQEEMGLGVRVATPLTQTRGGTIVSSAGLRSARDTWGQPARWCDCSGVTGDQPVGITLIPDAGNFRESWWHNRDYGLMVANPFGRAAMKQGPPSMLSVPRGASFEIRFRAVIHEGAGYDPAAETRELLKVAPPVP